MSKIVSNATPLIYLGKVGKLNLLECIFGEVIISPARTASEILGLTPRGTIFVLLKALKIKEITFDEFLKTLDELLKEGFRLKEEVYLEAIETAKKITQH